MFSEDDDNDECRDDVVERALRGGGDLMKYATAVEDRVDYRPTVSTHQGEKGKEAVIETLVIVVGHSFPPKQSRLFGCTSNLWGD